MTAASPFFRTIIRPAARALASALAPLVIALSAACTADQPTPTAPPSGAGPSLSSALAASTTFTLSSVAPPIVCTDGSGATTTVTGGTVTLLPSGKFSAAFTTSTTSGDVTTTSSYTEKGAYSVSGSTVTFKVWRGGTYTGTLATTGTGTTLTIADYPLCAETHTAIFVQA